ncbi:flagellar basal body rod protein FlgF [Variovorax ginsengisoli]|uniref:Flagellar basal-body rod protein FlgF n=1 Tax=Variovorax ginsengisoli TaxID=363844 RepID=A0ABT9SD38_9BURK|nr:flagellar basal body rod protein FlgF [Variovorax ginsengisoli]MDP9902277.1 flagellar basal-body rod protein FlgF [Variovorax ginsengisoli]
MDRMLYVAMSGAKQAMEQQASTANNMANTSTPGFRAQINEFRAVPVTGEEIGTRAFVVATTPSANFNQGPVQDTGNPLDIAIRGDGWLAVTDANGQEAYTRAGNLRVGSDGQILAMGNYPVVGDGGGIVAPPGQALGIGADGMVSARAVGDPNAVTVEVGRLKLVNPKTGDLVRGDDGLFRMREGLPAADADRTLTVTSGVIEQSNVNPVEAMVAMIANARSFELQMKSIQTANENAQSANKLLAYG